MGLSRSIEAEKIESSYKPVVGSSLGEWNRWYYFQNLAHAYATDKAHGVPIPTEPVPGVTSPVTKGWCDLNAAVEEFSAIAFDATTRPLPRPKKSEADYVLGG